MVPVRRRWVTASFGLTLTLGALAGAVYLLSDALGYAFPLDHRQLHGHTQVFGFAGLLAIGLVEATLPKALGLPQRRISVSAFWFVLAAVLLRNLSQPFATFLAGRIGVVLSALLLAMGCVPVVSFVFSLLEEAKPKARGGRLPVASAATSVYLTLSVGVNALQALWIGRGNGPALPRELTEAFADVSLSGMLLAAGFGLGIRLAPALGKTSLRHRLVTAAFAAQAAGVGLALLSWLPGLSPHSALPRHDGARLLIDASVLLYLRGTGFVSSRGTYPVAEPSLRASDTGIRLAFASLGLWAVLDAATIALARLTPLAVRNHWWEDAGRHLFTVGFVTLLIVGAAGRLASFLFGRPLASASMQLGAVALVAAGTCLRLLQYPALVWPDLRLGASLMGFPVVAGLVLLARNLSATAEKLDSRYESG